MANENNQVLQDQTIPSQTQTPQEPTDIAQAFQMVRDLDKGTAQVPAQEGESIQEETGSQARSGESGQSQADGGYGSGDNAYEPEASTESAGGNYLGGPAAAQPQYDYEAAINGLKAALQDEAEKRVKKLFEDQNIDIEGPDPDSLYERREDGTVIFHNPDNPHKPFESRTDADAWCNTLRSQIQREKAKEEKRIYEELEQIAEPVFKLMEFAPYYDAMDADVRDVFDKLIEPFSVVNQRGDVVGFRVNYFEKANTAKNIVDNWKASNKQQAAPVQQEQPKQQPKTPAMDLKSGSGSSADNEEPTTMEEAMAMIAKRNKENRNG